MGGNIKLNLNWPMKIFRGENVAPGKSRCHIPTDTPMAGGKGASVCAAIEVYLRRWRGLRLTSPSFSRTTKSKMLPPTTSGPLFSVLDEEECFEAT